MFKLANGTKPSVFFWVFSLAGIFIALTAYSESTLYLLYFLWKPPFLLFIKIFCAASLCFLILKLFNQRLIPADWLKLIGGLIFLPVLILPVFRCYFKVPYIFCRSCPAKCPWGISRTFLLSVFVGLNLSGKFWCSSLCPFGTFQEAQAQISKKHFNPAPWLSAVSYITLILIAGIYFLTLSASSWVRYFENGWYVWAAVTVFVAAVILATAFFIPKFWCRYLCPISTIAELTSRFQKSLLK